MIDLKVGTKGASHAASQHKVASIKQNINFWLAVMGKGGMTRRALSEKTGIEIASLCAALKSGEKEGIYETLTTRTCPTTGREVAVYTMKGTQ